MVKNAAIAPEAGDPRPIYDTAADVFNDASRPASVTNENGISDDQHNFRCEAAKMGIESATEPDLCVVPVERVIQSLTVFTLTRT